MVEAKLLATRSPLPISVAARQRHTVAEPKTVHFQTRQIGDPLDYTRTYGVLTNSSSGRPRDFEDQARALARPRRPGVGARGKVAVAWSEMGRSVAACYQVSDGGAVARLAACGNTMAAVAGWRISQSGSKGVSLEAQLPGDTRLRVDAQSVGGSVNLLRSAPDGILECSTITVRQTWRATPLSVRRATIVEGRKCFLAGGPLNDYVIVQTSDGESALNFSLGQALDVWRRVGGGGHPLSARMAVVERVSNKAPRVKFFTCGEREHPSAPLTGLATLVLAARLLDWSWLPPEGIVTTPAGSMRVPRIDAPRQRTDAIEADVEWAPVVVEIIEHSSAVTL